MRFRGSRGKRAIAVHVIVLAGVLAWAIPSLDSGSLTSIMFALALLVLWLAGLPLRIWVFGVTFTADAVVIQGFLRRTISRASIEDVYTQEWYGNDRVVLKIPHDVVRLPFPTSGPFGSDAGADFDAKARAIKEWAESGRVTAF
jgi:hypothetical protein